MNRRGFLTGIIAAAAAPVIIRTPGLIMPIKPRLIDVGSAVNSWGQGTYYDALDRLHVQCILPDAPPGVVTHFSGPPNAGIRLPKGTVILNLMIQSATIEGVKVTFHNPEEFPKLVA